MYFLAFPRGFDPQFCAPRRDQRLRMTRQVRQLDVVMVGIMMK
jgi:hypothetical protein